MDLYWFPRRWEPSNAQQAALALAPDSTVRFRLDDWPGEDFDAAQWSWRKAQQDYSTTATPEDADPLGLGPCEYAWEWHRRETAMLAKIPDTLLWFDTADYPDAVDDYTAWLQFGEARRAWFHEHVWATGADLADERARREKLAA